MSREKNTGWSGVNWRYGSKTLPNVAVAPLLMNGPIQRACASRIIEPLYECRWYAMAPGMNSTVDSANTPSTLIPYQPA